MTTPRDPWRAITADLFHLGDEPAAIVERHPRRDEWHWRCPAIARGGVEGERGAAMRAARRALREALREAGEG